MKKAAILYVSVHHKNTEKVVNYIASAIDADVIDLLKNRNPSIEQYELIILASGIYFGSFHKVLLEYMKATSFEGKNIIILYTCGVPYRDYVKSAEKFLRENNINYIVDFHCRGYDTYGLFGKIGGLARKHPNQRDLDRMLESVKVFADIILK